MQFKHLGVIVFFGIVVPGAYLTVFLILTFACILELNGIPGHAKILKFIKDYSILSASAFFFMAYLFGVILRLFAPNAIDNSIKKQKENLTETFPNYNRIKKCMADHGMEKITDLVESLNPRYGINDNTTFFNYCKQIIEIHNETLAKHIQQEEALIRFLAGTSLALNVSYYIGIIFSVTFYIMNNFLFCKIYILLMVVSFLAFLLIYSNFSYQRRREIMTVWCGIYLMLKGAIPNVMKLDPEELKKRISMAPYK